MACFLVSPPHPSLRKQFSPKLSPTAYTKDFCHSGSCMAILSKATTAELQEAGLEIDVGPTDAYDLVGEENLLETARILALTKPLPAELPINPVSELLLRLLVQR